MNDISLPKGCKALYQTGAHAEWTVSLVIKDDHSI